MKLAKTGKKKTGKFGQGKYTIVQNIVALQHVGPMWIQVCIRHSGVYRGHYRYVKGRLFVSYKSYFVLLKYMIG